MKSPGEGSWQRKRAEKGRNSLDGGEFWTRAEWEAQGRV